VKNLFIGNLGSEVTHEELRRLFEAYGQVVQVHIIVDQSNGVRLATEPPLPTL
jgi:RNA recognition motif-containing protein